MFLLIFHKNTPLKSLKRQLKFALQFDTINIAKNNNYNILKIHTAWVEYISKVYRGEFSPAIPVHIGTLHS